MQSHGLLALAKNLFKMVAACHLAFYKFKFSTFGMVQNCKVALFITVQNFIVIFSTAAKTGSFLFFVSLVEMPIQAPFWQVF